MIYLAQLDLLRDLGNLEPGQLFLVIIVMAMIVLIFLSRSSGGAIAQSAMKTLDKLVDRFERVTEELTEQRGELKEQQSQGKLLTEYMATMNQVLKELRQGQENLTNAIQASVLTAEGTNEIITAIGENTDALIVKVDNTAAHLEADTAATQKLITESAEKTIKATGERLTELDTVIRALPENFCKDIKEALSSDLTAVQTTLNSIMAHLSAQKEASNETPFTPTVDLPLVPDGGKSGNGTGDTTIDTSAD